MTGVGDALRITAAATPFLMMCHAAEAKPTETAIHIFDGKDGDQPIGGLIRDAAGNLYGTASQGGKVTATCPAPSNPPAGSLDTGGCGTVFKLTPPAKGKTAWTETVLLKFNGANGAAPAGDLIMDKAGNLYGTTYGGGTGTAFCIGQASSVTPKGCGVVFKLTPPAKGTTAWTETVLFEFNGANGARLLGGLTMDAAGNLYGTAGRGGAKSAVCPATPEKAYAAGCGLVFKLSPPAAGATGWKETILHQFGKRADGNSPASQLVLDAAGNLYGTTTSGGSANCPANVGRGFPAGCGIVFKLAKPAAGATNWTETILHTFGGSPDGANPRSGIAFDKAGNAYGTTACGGAPGTGSKIVGGTGLVYELTPSFAGTMAWKETILHSFNTKGDGTYPYTPPTLDPTGAVLGAASSGGTAAAGIVFKLTPPAGAGKAWTETILHSFAPTITPDGLAPIGNVVLDPAANLYGTTAADYSYTVNKSAAGPGAVYEITP